MCSWGGTADRDLRGVIIAGPKYIALGRSLAWAAASPPPPPVLSSCCSSLSSSTAREAAAVTAAQQICAGVCKYGRLATCSLN